jgi:hypothetical protein
MFAAQISTQKEFFLGVDMFASEYNQWLLLLLLCIRNTVCCVEPILSERKPIKNLRHFCVCVRGLWVWWFG